MSLINKALRKAQRDRTPARMPTGAPQGSNPSHGSPAFPAAANGYSPTLIIGLSLTVAVLIGLVAGLSIVIFRDDSTPAATTEPPVTLSAPAPERLPQPAPAAGETTDPQITPTVVSRDTSDGANPASIVEQLRSAREAAEAEKEASAGSTTTDRTDATKAEDEKVTAEAEVESAAEANDAVIRWLSASKISGVRLAGSASRVILNGEAYQAGETVNYNLGLKVLVIQETRVLFEDGNGKKYMKRL